MINNTISFNYVINIIFCNRCAYVCKIVCHFLFVPYAVLVVTNISELGISLVLNLNWYQAPANHFKTDGLAVTSTTVTSCVIL